MKNRKNNGSIFDPQFDYLRFGIAVAFAVLLAVSSLHLHQRPVLQGITCRNM